MAELSEITEVHTRILRLALGVEDARGYLENVDTTIPAGQRATTAFEQRWFGTKSMERVKSLLANFQARFDPFPEALSVLQSWKSMAPATRRLIYHWHLQLADPMYRKFTGAFLPSRRESAKPAFDRSVVVRWLNTDHPDRWSASTVNMFASKMTSAALEAGLIESRKNPRTPVVPTVPEEALGYVMYLLRTVTFDGSLTDNPYLTAVGLTGDFIEQRLRNFSGMRYRRMGELVEYNWRFDSLTQWAKETL